MDNYIIHLLKVHEYFRDVGEETLREIASAARVSHHDAGAVVHQPQDPLTSICFVLLGRLKAVRVDSRGDEHFFRDHPEHAVPDRRLRVVEADPVRIEAAVLESANYRRASRGREVFVPFRLEPKAREPGRVSVEAQVTFRKFDAGLHDV